jgi:cytochrome oxidase Cu insertion factor (SCO1/SenC/PrrC family)
MSETPSRRGRRQFLLLAVLFFAPVVAAYLYYFAFPDWQPAAKTHHGVLVDPARPLPALQLRDAAGQPLDEGALKGKWTLLYLGGTECGASCAEKNFQMRQIRILLNQNRDRARRVYAAPDAAGLAAARQSLDAALHTDLVFLDAGRSGLREFLGPAAADAVYLIDPLGNWLMTYPPESDYKGILKDLKKLLRISQIG